MQSISATYYNGKQSVAFPVQVKQEGNVLRITAEDQSFTKFWNLDEVKSNSYSSTKRISLQYGEFPAQILEFDDNDAVIIKRLIRNTSAIQQIEYKITQANPVKLVISSILVIGVTIATYLLFVAPFIGEQAVKILPRSVEVKAGNAIYNNIQLTLKKDSLRSAKLLEFYEVCGFASDYEIDFTYADNSMINAFALPGGKIIIFDGIIDEMESWEELAALMAHELAHVNERHSFEALAKSFSSYIFLSVLTGDVAGTSAIVIENASHVNDMANSRIFEKEADVQGLNYLKELQIQPEAMVNLFRRLSGKDEDVSKLEKGIEFLSTHPLTEKRIEYLKEIIASDQNYQYETIEIERAKEIWEELKQ